MARTYPVDVNNGSTADDPTASSIFTAFDVVNTNATKVANTRAFNVLDWAGVVGDGTNDDTAGIQACIDAAETTSGGIPQVEFPGGHTYIISSTLMVPPNGMYFRGLGANGANASDKPRLEWDGAINGLMWDVVATDAGQTNFASINWTNFAMLGNKAGGDKLDTFVRFRHDLGTVCSCDTGCFFDNVTFARNLGHAIIIDSATNMYFIATRWDEGSSNGGYGIYCHLRSSFYCHFTGECSWQGMDGAGGSGGFIFLDAEDITTGTPMANIALDSFKIETGASLAALGTGKIGTTQTQEYNKRGAFRFGVNTALGQCNMHCFISGLSVEMTGADGSMCVFQVTADGGTDAECAAYVNIIVDGGIGLSQGATDTVTTSVIRPIGGRVPAIGKPTGAWAESSRWGRFQYGVGQSFAAERVATWIYNPNYFLSNANRTVLGPVSTFANLNPAPVQGECAYITDCNTAVFNATAAAGGSTAIGVRYDGTNWKVC